MTILIPAFNEDQVIAACVRAARDVDYPRLDLLSWSKDGTVAVAQAAAGDDQRVVVVRDEVNVGKADRLNLGFVRG